MKVFDILQFPFRRRQKQQRIERAGATQALFVDSLATTPLEKKAADLLWSLLVDASVVDDFRPLPDDDLEWLYGLAEEDLDEDIILNLFNELEISPPSPATIQDLGVVRTPRDIIKLVSSACGPSGLE